MYATARLPTPLIIDRLGLGLGFGRGRHDVEEEDMKPFSIGRFEEDEETEFVDDQQILVTLQVSKGLGQRGLRFTVSPAFGSLTACDWSRSHICLLISKFKPSLLRCAFFVDICIQDAGRTSENLDARSRVLLLRTSPYFVARPGKGTIR